MGSTGNAALNSPLPPATTFRYAEAEGILAKLRAMRADIKTPGSIVLIKTAMIEKKMTQAELADAADCHEKTIQNLLSGRAVRDQTLFDVCMVLGLDFDKVKGNWLGELRDAAGPGATDGRAAPVYMGAYTRAGVDHYIGSYLTLRPSFSNPTRIRSEEHTSELQSLRH